jgi:uncharacterized protein YbjT (DUF2867 family)
MYVISGATGHTGSVVADRLLDKGEKVRVLGRDAKRLERFVRRGAEAFSTNVEDAGSLKKALAGAQGVYVMIPPSMGQADPRGYQKRVGDTFAEALRESGASHAFVLSSVGADKPDKTGPILGLRHLEQAVGGIAGLNVLCLRAGYFLENFLAQIQVIPTIGSMGGPLRPDLKLAMIATRDIGVRAADELARRQFAGKQTQELLGAEDLTCTRVASVIGKAIGKPDLQYAQLRMEQFKPALLKMGISAAVADQLWEMSESLNNGYIRPLETRSPKNTTPTTIEQFAAEVFAPAFKKRAAAA